MFVFRYTYGGRRRDLSLWMADFLRLSDAKTQAAECRRLLALNIDPKAVRDEKRAPKAEPESMPTFKEFFQARTDELEKLKNYRSPRGFPDFKRRIGKHIIESSNLGAFRIDEIEPADIARALAPLFEEKPKNRNRAEMPPRGCFPACRVRRITVR